MWDISIQMIKKIISICYKFLWGDLITIPLPGGSSLGLSLLVMILIPSGIYFTVKTGFVLVRLFPEMIRITMEKKASKDKNTISGVQALIVSTATRVGMGNLVGVVAAISAGGAGAVFWMWLIAVLSSSTAYVEAALAQIYKVEDPLYGGFKGGPAYYIHALSTRRKGGKIEDLGESIASGKKSLVAVLFAVSALVCWAGISQVIGNSVSSAFDSAFGIPPLYSTIALVAISAVIVLRKRATVKVLDLVVPVMAAIYFVLTVFIIVTNLPLLPQVFSRILSEAFGLRQAVAGGFGAVLMNGAKRGLFSNEAGSGSAPCAAAAADIDHPAKAGLLQAFGVFIDTIVICTCTAMIILLTPAGEMGTLEGMALLEAAMAHHLGRFGVIFIAIVLWLFSFSTFLGILFYARSNVSYLFGDKWLPQIIYKLIALVMLFIGGLATYTFVWDLGDVGVGLMTIFNMIALFPMAGEALGALRDYQEKKDRQR